MSNEHWYSACLPAKELLRIGIQEPQISCEIKDKTLIQRDEEN